MQSVLGLPPVAFGRKKQRRHRIKRAPLNARKPPECLPFQLFDRIKSHRRLPLAATNQTIVKTRLRKRSDVPTWHCREPEALSHVLAHLEELVIKEVNGSGGYGMLVGPH